jgi:hypothetical protein
LEVGTRFAFRILNQCNKENRPCKFLHLVLARRWHRPTEYRVITSRRVEVGGKRYRILPKRCGVSLAGLIEM